MIHSSAIEGHHFLLSRRRGYDPTEVDAVIKRVVDTLRKYEEREEALLEAQSAAPVADLHEVRAAREGLIDDAEFVSRELELAARAKLDDADRTAAQLVAEAEEEAAHIIEMARADAGNLLSRRNARAEALITSALSEVKGLRGRVIHETTEYRAGKKTEAAALVRTAELQANQLLEDARHDAGSILGRARREHTMLERRIGQLRSAIAGIEGQFRHLAETTLEQTEIMSTMISVETNELEDDIDVASDEPEVVRLTQGGLTVDLTDGADESDQLPDHILPHHVDERFAVAPGDTIYQRRVGLRQRLEDEVDESFE
jgi:DivIVA domain-containing protein